jgi:DNA replication initiation complex subunit (GINS family)
LAKAEAARFVDDPRKEATETEARRVFEYLKKTYQRRYGLVEAG